ncbi:MAG: hypothetical protein K9G65_02355, partial [Rickettsiaceae bacterium]|nr:hypothetical protein [Rickettsiaceae bacterium]
WRSGGKYLRHSRLLVILGYRPDIPGHSLQDNIFGRQFCAVFKKRHDYLLIPLAYNDTIF